MSLRPIFRIALVIIACAFSHLILAQSGTHTSGGEGTGAGGSVSFSVGQVFNSILEGETYSITQGVQQPFEISIIDGIEDLSISIDVQLFPNPATDWINLRIQTYDFQGLQFKMTSLDGKTVFQENIQADLTIIPIAQLPSSTYILTVIRESNQLKTFKIIKP